MNIETSTLTSGPPPKESSGRCRIKRWRKWTVPLFLLLGIFAFPSEGMSQCPTPTNVQANSSTICVGGTSNLRATTITGHTIRWYTVPTGGSSIGSSNSNANFPVSPTTTRTYYAGSAGPAVSGGSQTYNYNGSSGFRTFTVPAGVTSISIDVRGGQGRSNARNVAGGLGGRIVGGLAVTPGQVLRIYVGGGGGRSTAGFFHGGANAGATGCVAARGGGGGGRSEVRRSPYGFNTTGVVAVAGGGGGAGGDRIQGCGPGSGGGGGGGWYGGGGGAGYDGTGGRGGGQSGGGAGGTSPHTGIGAGNGGAGGLANGGAGGVAPTNNQAGTNTGPRGGAGGAGTGATGGSGAPNWRGGGGGGGSNRSNGMNNVSNYRGWQSGNGQVVIRWQSTSGCNSSSRAAVTVNVVPDPTVSVSSSGTICVGGNRTLTATTSGGTGTCTFQWQRRPVGGSWTNVGTNSSTYNTGSLSSTFQYRVVRNCNGSGCADPGSNVVTVTVVPDPTVSISSSGTICVGGNRTLNASTSGGTGTCTFQWQRRPVGGSWTNVGSNSSTYNTGSLSSTFQYRVVRNCNGSGCNDPGSNVVTVTVVADPTVSISSGATICVGGNRTFTATTSGGTGTCTFQWQRRPVGGSWTNVGSNSSTYNTGSLSSTFQYRVVRNCNGSGCNDPGSNVSTVTVVADPSVSITGGGLVCLNGNRTLTASTSGGTGTCTFQWQRATSTSGPWTNVGTNSSTYNTGALTSTFVYRVLRNCNGSGCNDPTSNTQTVTVDNVAPNAVCQNVTVQLNASGSASVTANQVNNGSSDNCALSAISVTPSSFNCSNLGGNTVTFTAADNNGNTSTCNATVTVQDNIAPSVTCQNITVNIPASLTASVTPAQVTSTLSDNCSISSSSVSPNSFDCADLGGTFTVTVNASDASGNSNSCTASVTVADPGQNCNAPPVAVCQDITVNANGNCQGLAVATDFDGGSSDPDLDPLTFSVSPAGPYALGTTNVTLTVTDPSGETDNCAATITVEDNTPPTAVCQNVTVQLNAAGNGSITAAQINNGSSDNCSISAISVTPSSFNCSDVGGNTVTFTVTDGSGNNSTCTASVTVQDNVAPVANCQDVTVQLNAAGNGSVTAAQVNNGSSDACGISSLSVTPSSFNCSNVGNNTVTLTVTDNNTNSSTCTATVTVQDNVAPVANCQDLTVQLNAGGNGSVTAAQVNNGSSDACGISSLSVTPSSFNCSNVGNNTVTLTVTDNNANSSTCTATINVQDNVAPVANCQDVTIQLNAAGNGSVTATQVNNGSSDACGISSLSVTPSSFTCSNVGNNTVTLTVTDNNSNSSTCTATINVQDNVAPVAICQDITVQLSAAGNASITPQDIDNGSSDACGLAGLSITPNSFTCANVGGNTVTLTATDNNNNSSTCTASVTIEDNVNPVAICQDITVQLNASGNASITPQDVDNGSNDACGIASLSVTPNSFACANVGANTVTLTATDNNTNSATCTATVTVEDNVAPVAICQDITVQLGASGSASITAQDVDNGSSDACGIASLSVTPNSFTCANVSGNTATLTVTDNNGNVSTCTGTITVEDSVAPIAICQDITAQLNASGNASITAQDVDNGSNDACGIASLSVTPNSFTCGNVGGNAVVLTVTDSNGNTSTCGATVTIEDNVNPVALCQDITVQLDASGNASITPQDVDNGSNDACGIASLSVTPNSFTCGNVGANTVTLTATDNNTNSSTCTAVVTVEDNVNPVALCQDITVQLNASGSASITPQDVDNGSNDACGIASLSVTPNSFTCANVGANTVTLTATDNNTNSATCTATVTVEDNVNPVAICQDITVQLDASGNTSITPQDVDNGSNDACGIASLSVTPNTFNCANIGGNTVTLTVTDNNTNSSTCTASVTVEDSVAPIAICQDITVQLNASGSASITPQDVDNGSNDACGIASLSVTPNSFTCSNVNGNAVVLTVTDNNGNTSTCGATVTIEDNVNPVALCQDITVQLDASGNASITPQDVDNGSNDACGIASLSVTPNSFTCANVGGNTVTLTATDNNANSATCTATVTIEDNVDPVAICQDITVQLDASGNTSITPQDVDNGSNDACGIASLSVTPNSFTCSNVGGNTVTLTVTDNNSNSSTCTAVVAVEDNVNPVALCQDITVQLDAAGNTSITPQDIDNGSNDACGIASLSVTPNSFTCANVGGNTVTLTVTDNNTNSSTCTAIVSVEDNVDPVAICQDITIQLDATGNTSITPQQVDNGSNDACGIASLAVSPNSFVCADTGSNAVVLTVTDNNGNVSTCGATVTVEDNVNPVAVCQDITVQLAANGTATITPQDVDNGSGDACGVGNLSIDISTFSCNNVAGNTVTLTVTDNNGNSSSCTSTVTIQDNVPPVAVCQDITVQLDSLGLVSILPQDVDGGTNDACGVALLELSDSSFICADTNANTVILTASDVNGNSSNCTATVTVEDNIAPVVLCMDATVSLNSLGEATLLPLDVDAGTSDNCGLQSLIVVPGVYGCQDVQGVTATLRAIDISGNLSTCTMQITVLDQVLPVAQCKDVTVQLDATGNGATTPFDVDNGSNDACGIATYVLDTQTFDCADVGANPVVLTVTDNNGNVNTCNANVEVEDNVNPIAICQDLTIQLDATGNASITPQQVDNGSNDACGIQSLALNDLDFTCADVASGGGSSGPTPTDLFISEYVEGTTTGDQVLEFFNGTGAPIDLGAGGYAIDLHLNGASTPNLSIPLSGTVANNDVFVLADNNASALVTNAADQIANFNFTGDDAVVLRKGTITLDIFGVVGNDPGNRWFDPIQTIIGTRNQTLVRLPSVAGGVTTNPTGTGANAFTTLGTEWSAQGANNFTNLGSHTFAGSTGGGGGGNNTVTLTVTDVNGNASICTADIRVEDNVDPVAICQDVTVQLDASGNGSTTPQDVDNGSNDACGIDSLALSQTDFVCSEVGANTETLTVFDVNGNSSTCTATVTVEDNVPPVALCQDVTVQLDASGNGSTTAQAVDNGSNDACGIQSLVLSQTDFVCSEVGANTETLTVTDVNGNVTTCTATVTVEDNVPPVAICQDVTVQLDATGNGTTTPQDVDNGSNDACGIQSLVLSQTAFVCSEVGANTEVLTVTDNNGNVTTCTATVTVEDNVPPVAICQDVTVQLDASGNGSTTAQDVDNGSNDACGIQSISLSQTAFVCSEVGPNTETLTVTDVNGNVSTCTATVTVEDNVPPVAICQDVTVQLDASGNGSTTAQAVDNGSNDACGIQSLVLSQTDFVCSEVGANAEVLTVTDVNGNVSTCSATVTVEDNVPPVAICQDVTVQLDASGNGSTTAQDVDNGSNDACGIQSLVLSQTAFVCSEVGPNTEVLTVTDVNGNVTTCTATVTVEDNVPPVAICQDVTVQLDASGNGSTTAQAVDNGSNDACGIQSISLSQTDFVCSEVGANTEVLTVTDVNGNVSTCTTTVTVEDNVPPVAICQDVTVQLDASGNGSTTPQDVDNGSNDACGIQSLVLSQTDFVCSEVGANTEVLTVTDVNGNVSTCTTTVTVEDNVPPVAICQDVTVQLDASGNGSTTAQDVDNGSNDACGIQSLVLSQTDFVCSEVGPNTEVLTVTDVNGNVSTCTTTVTVEDNVPPVALCQDVTVQLDASGNGSTTAQAVDNGSNDACGIQSLVLSQTDFVCSEVGANTEVLTVTDVNGNVSTCTTTVTVEDNVPPVAICQNVTINLPSSGNVSVTAQDIDNGSNDACGIDTIYLDMYTFNCTFQGPNTVTLTVVDVNGNVSTCTATVTVTVDPLVAVLSSPVFNCGYNISCFGLSDGEATATVTGGCLPYTYLWNDPANQTTATASNLAAGTYAVTVTDVNGNTTTESITLTQPDSLIVDLGADVAANFGCSCVDLAPASIVGGCQPYNYLWGTAETTNSITVCPNKTTFYPVTITDDNGCQAKDSVYVIKPSAQGQTDEYVILGLSRVIIGDQSFGINGAIGVNGPAGQMTVGSGADLDLTGNNWILGENISIGSSANIGDIYTNNAPTVGAGSATGSINPLPTPGPTTPCAPPIPGGNNITVPANQTVNLTPGDYGTLYIASRGVLSMAPGIYTFTQINTASSANFVSASGFGSDVGVFVSGTVGFGDFSSISANIAALTSRIQVGNGATVYGSLVADQVSVGRGCALKLESFCWPDANCGINKEEVAEIESSLGDDMEILAYPNPFRESTTLQFRLVEANQVTIEIYNVNGVHVTTLFNEAVEAGVTKEVTFTPEDKTAGLYFYRLTTGKGEMRNGKLIFQR